MRLRWTDTLKFVKTYLIGYLLFCGLLFVGMKWYQARNFSKIKLEEILSTVSSLRDKTDDPCRYYIFGEPATAQSQYVKVNIHCSADSKSINSMDLRAIKNKTIGGAITELARVNNFLVKIDGGKIVLGERNDLNNKTWTCLYNQKAVRNFEEPLVQKATIDCYNGLSDVEMAKYL